MADSYTLDVAITGLDSLDDLQVSTDVINASPGAVSSPGTIDGNALLAASFAGGSKLVELIQKWLDVGTGAEGAGEAIVKSLQEETLDVLQALTNTALAIEGVVQAMAALSPLNKGLAGANILAGTFTAATSFVSAVRSAQAGKTSEAISQALDGVAALFTEAGAIAAFFPGGQGVSLALSGIGWAIFAAQHWDQIAKGLDWLGHLFNGNHTATPPFSVIHAGLPGPRDPLVINFANAGLPDLTPLANSPVHFDYDGHGFAVQTGWVGSQTGLLGIQDSTGAFRLLGATSGSGFADLAALDEDGNSRIDPNDAAFGQLRVWVDSNGNGQVDSGEMLTMDQAGIAAVNSNVQALSTGLNGNSLTASATFEYSSGQVGSIFEVNFATSALQSIYTPPPNFRLDEAVLMLPELRGYGLLPDLSIAMSLDGGLRDQVTALVNDAQSLSATQFKQAFTDILYRWAGVADEDPASRGPNVDARQYDFLLKLYGIDPGETNAYTAFDPNGLAGGRDAAVFADAMNEMMIRFFAQVGTSLGLIGSLTTQQFVIPASPITDAFSSIGFDPSTDTLTFDLRTVVNAVVSDLPSDVTAAAQYLGLASVLLGALHVDATVQNSITLDQLGAQTAMFADAAGLTPDLVQGLVQPIVGTVVAISDLTQTSGSFSAARGTNLMLLGNGIAAGEVGPLTVTGNGASDAYVYLSSMNRDVIVADSGASLDFGDLKLSDVSLARTGVDLIVTVEATGQTLTVKNQFASAGLTQLWFSDGTVLDREGIGEAAPYYAGDGDATLIAEDGPRTLVAGAGNDTFYGGLGKDTFVYAARDGNLTLGEHVQWYWLHQPPVANTLKLTDLNASDVTFSRTGTTLDVAVNATGKVITFAGQFDPYSYGYIGTMQFADGSSWGTSQISSAAWYRAGPGDVTVTAESANAVIVAGPGDDTLIGFNAGDTFLYGSVDGNATIVEYWPTANSSNTLKLTDLNASDLSFNRVGNNLQITVDSTGKVINLTGEYDPGTGAALAVGSIDFADGTTWTGAAITAGGVYHAGPGDVTVQAQGGPATLVAGPGNDLLIGGNGDDTFVYGSTDGNLNIEDRPLVSGAANDTLKLTDLNATDLSFTATGNSLFVTVNATGRSIIVDAEFYSGFTGIQHIQFADGTVWDKSQIEDATVWSPVQVVPAAQYIAGDGDATIEARTGDAVMVAGIGNDTFIGGNGNNTFVYASVDGNLAVQDSPQWWWATDDNTLKLTDLNAPDVTVARVNLSLQITVNVTGKTVTLSNEYLYGQGVQHLQFADGTTWDRQQMLTAGGIPEIFAGPNDTWIQAPRGYDATIHAGTGDLEIVGGDQSDTFVYDSADGNLALYVLPDGYQNNFNTLRFDDLNASDLTIGRNATNDLVITVNATGKTVTVGAQFFSNNPPIPGVDGVQQIQFADGTIWSRSDIASIASFNVGPGDVTLQLPDGDVTVAAGSGNDTIAAGNGNDTFVYRSTNGNLLIKNDPIWGQPAHANTLTFADLNAGDLSFARTGNSLGIVVDATGKTVTVDQQYLAGFGVQSLRFADGTTWSLPQILASGWRQVGSGEAETVSGDNMFLTVPESASLSVTGGNNDIEVDGDHANALTDGDSNIVALRGNSDSATMVGPNASAATYGNNENITITGDNGTVTILADDAVAVINGNGGRVGSYYNRTNYEVIGNFASINSSGEDATIQVRGDDSIVSSHSGNANITVVGNDATISSFGDGAVIQLHGDDGRVDTFSDGAAIQIQGNRDRFTSFANDTVVSITGNAAAVSAFGNNETIRVAGDGASVTAFGDHQSVALAGGDSTVTVYGTNESVLVSGNRNDAISYGSSDGNFEIGTVSDPVASAAQGVNTLTLSDLNVADVTLRRVVTSLEIDVTATGSAVVVDGEFFGGIHPVDQVVFADGTTWGFPQLLEAAPDRISADNVSATSTFADDFVVVTGSHDTVSVQGDGATAYVTGNDDQLLMSGAGQAAAVSGDDDFVDDVGTGGTVSLDGAGGSIDLAGASSGNTVTLTADGMSVRDFGTGNTTTMSGDHQVGQFYGTNGTIVSTGQGNYIDLTGTQNVTVTGEDTGLNNMGTGIDITLSAAGDTMSMNGSDDTTTVTGDHITVADFGVNDVTTLSGNFDNASLQGTNGTVVSTGHDNTITLSGDSQTVTATGANTYVSNGGTGLTVALAADGDSIDLTAGASGNTTTLAAEGGSVRDFGTDNVTTMAGDHQVGQFYGTHGTVVSTGQGNYLILTGSQSVTVTGENTGVNNAGTGIDITLSAAGDTMSMNGSNDTTTVTGDHITVADFGVNDVTTLSGNFDNASLQGTNGTIVSTGHDNTITLSGDSQTVTATGANTYVSNGGTGLTVTLAAAGDSIDLTAGASGNTTMLSTDGGSVRDFGTDNITTMAGNNQVGQFYGTNGTVISTGQGNYLILTGTQTVTVTGENTGVNNAGSDTIIQLLAAGDTMMMTGSHDATVVTGDHITVGDAGTNDTTLLFGNFDNANLAGSRGTVVSTGRGNSVTVSGNGQTISVTGEDTLVTNAGTNMYVSLSAAGDSIGLTGSSAGNYTRLAGDGLSVADYGTNNVTDLAGDHEVGEFYGTVGVVSSTGAHNYLILDGSQLVTVSGADTGINDVGNGSVIALGGTGDYLTLGGFSNSTTITADGVSVHDNFGSNQFTIANGAGNDTLQLSGSLSDTARFGSGIAYDQLWFAQSGQDLVMSVIGRDQSLTVAGWYGGASNHLGELETADGHQISDSGMQQMVQAMSAYTPPAEGQTTLPPDLASALAPALTTNWQHA